MSYVFYAVSDDNFNIVSMNNGAGVTTKAVFSSREDAEKALAKAPVGSNLKVIPCQIVSTKEGGLK